MAEEEENVDILRQDSAPRLPAFLKRHNDKLRIAFFEGIGTFILTYGICCSQYLPPIKDKIPNPFHSLFISCALFLALCWSGAITGGHINPAVTLGQMFRAPKIKLRTALVYMASQLVGAFFGAMIAWACYGAVAGPYDHSVDFGDLFLDFIGEVIGTFFFVFFILMATTESTSFIQDTHWVYIFICLLLYTCRTFSFRVQSLNPAVAFAVMFWKSIYLGNGMLLVYTISIILGPFIGGALAGLFFEKVYRKIYVDWKQRNQIE